MWVEIIAVFIPILAIFVRDEARKVPSESGKGNG